jgi:hypothetical protein
VVVTNVGSLCSLVTHTSKCGWAITCLFHFIFCELESILPVLLVCPMPTLTRRPLSFGPRPHIYLFKRELSLYFQMSNPEENQAVKGLDCGHKNISSPHASVSLFFFKSLRRISRQQTSYYGSPTF